MRALRARLACRAIQVPGRQLVEKQVTSLGNMLRQQPAAPSSPEGLVELLRGVNTLPLSLVGDAEVPVVALMQELNQLASNAAAVAALPPIIPVGDDGDDLFNGGLQLVTSSHLCDTANVSLVDSYAEDLLECGDGMAMPLRAEQAAAVASRRQPQAAPKLPQASEYVNAPEPLGSWDDEVAGGGDGSGAASMLMNVVGGSLSAAASWTTEKVAPALSRRASQAASGVVKAVSTSLQRQAGSQAAGAAQPKSAWYVADDTQGLHQRFFVIAPSPELARCAGRLAASADMVAFEVSMATTILIIRVP